MTLFRNRMRWDKEKKATVVVPTVRHRDKWIELTVDKLDRLVEMEGKKVASVIESQKMPTPIKRRGRSRKAA